MARSGSNHSNTSQFNENILPGATRNFRLDILLQDIPCLLYRLALIRLAAATTEPRVTTVGGSPKEFCLDCKLKTDRMPHLDHRRKSFELSVIRHLEQYYPMSLTILTCLIYVRRSCCCFLFCFGYDHLAMDIHSTNVR